MIVAFCGHSQIFDNGELVNKVLESLEAEVNGEDVDFYLGGYGEFDCIAKKSCKQYQKLHTNAKLYFVTPYVDDTFLKNREQLLSDCDGSIYPEIENTPKRFAISARNKWMVRQADLVIAFVNYSWGGAVKTLEYAHKTKTRYINLGTYKIDA